MPESISIPHVAWRNGRPRFSPSASLRKQGHKGHDLKNADGSWMTHGQCIDWSADFSRKIDDERQAEKEKRAKRKKQAIVAVRRSLPKAAVRKSYTLGQMLEDYTTNGLIGKAAMTVSCYRSWSNAVKDEAPEAWNSEAIAITRPIVRGLYRLLLKKRSTHTAQQVMRVLSSAYNWAEDEGILEIDNPVYRISPVTPDPRTRAATVEEYLHLVATADKLELEDVGDMIVWGVWTAQRAGDRIGITRRNIVDDRLEIKQQKTGAEVSIPVSAAIRARRYDRALTYDEYFFALPGGDVKQRYKNYNDRWRKVIKEAKKAMPSVSDLRDQDLRDTAVSWMGRAGCTTQQIFAITGHRQQGETRILRHYMAAHFDIADQAIEKLEAWYNKQLARRVAPAETADPCDISP